MVDRTLGWEGWWVVQRLMNPPPPDASVDVFQTVSSPYPLYGSTSASYEKALQSHRDECDLMEEIDPSLLETKSQSEIFLVRNAQNDDVFPFQAEAFIRWFERSPTHPLTRERLDYLAERVALKKQALTLVDIKFGDRTPEWQDQLLQQWDDLMRQEAASPSPSSVYLTRPWLACRLFIDEALLSDRQWIHATLNYGSTVHHLKDRPPGSWLLRTSSQHYAIMKNARLLVLAWVDQLQGVVQTRLLHVQGVGWYLGGQTLPLTSFRELMASRHPAPDFVTLVDVIVHYHRKKRLQWSGRVQGL